MVATTKKKPRPKANPQGAVRARVLGEATRLFAARGFDGTALQDVASAVGVSKPSVLHHFPSKEALRQGVLAEMMAHFNLVLPQLLLASSGGRRLRSLMEALCSFFVEDPDRARVLMREVLDRPREVKALLGAGVRPFVDAIASHLREEQARGAAPADLDPEAYLLHVLRMVISTTATMETFSALLPDARGAQERQLRELLRITERSLFPNAPSSPRSPVQRPQTRAQTAAAPRARRR